MTGKHWKLEGKKATPCDEILEWAAWFESANRRVRLTRVGPYLVSTVFLGLDHQFIPGGPPLLFETMVYAGRAIEPPPVQSDEYGREWLDEQERCSTWEEAERQHQAMIDKVREPSDKVEDMWEADNE